LLRVLARRRGRLREDICSCSPFGGNQDTSILFCGYRIQVVANGCEECLLEWVPRGASLCEATPGFESVEFPHRVYKLRKALYGLKQAPRAWYGRLRGFLFSKGFEMGKVDKTLFLLKKGDDILIVQVYVDDIVFSGVGIC
jgi:hypothetical protein